MHLPEKLWVPEFWHGLPRPSPNLVQLERTRAAETPSSWRNCPPLADLLPAPNLAAIAQGLPGLAPGSRMLSPSPHQGFHFFILDQTEAHAARVLQTGSEEIDTLRRFRNCTSASPKSCGLNFSRKPFESDLAARLFWPKRSDQIVERGLAL